MNIFLEISVILIITTLCATAARLLRQPLLIGYILSGIIVGPMVLDIFSSHHELELFSKVGITILLFIVGIHLNPETLKETGKPALLAGFLQIGITTIVGYLLFIAFNVNVGNNLALAFALALSSTIVVLKMLSDAGEVHTTHGKLLVGILIVQDIAATLGLVLLPLVGSSAGGSIIPALAKLALSGLAAGIVLYLIAKYILPLFSDYLAKSSELLLLFSLSWGLILSALFYKLGFSIEVGALVAGITLSSSKYAHEISAKLHPLRDVFVVFFFVLLGSGLDLNTLGTSLVAVIIISLFVLVGNPLIVYGVMRTLSYQRRSSLSSSLALGQVSEFSLIFLSLAVGYGVVSNQALSIATLVTIITIIGSSYFFEKRSFLFKLISLVDKKDPTAAINNETSKKEFDLLVFGFGRVGLEFIHAAKKSNMSALAIDNNPEVFTEERLRGVDVVFGDVDSLEFLEELPLATARYIISTIPDIHVNLFLLENYRKKNSEGVALFVARTPQEAEQLYTSGATYVILPHYLGAFHATEMLSNHALDADIFKKAKQVQDKQIEKHASF